VANDKKFVVKRGLATPNVDFANGGGTISATFLSTSNTLSFSGNTGQLFSITDSMSGTIFSVNDISGIPSIEVIDTGSVKLAETFGSVAIGANTIANYKFYVSGNTLLGNTTINNSLTLTNDKRLGFNTLNGNTVYMIQQNDDNFVLYTTTTTGAARPVFSVYANTNTSNLSVVIPLQLSSTIVANSSTGSAGQVLTSSGAGVYWGAAGAGANNATYLAGRTWETAGAIGATVANTGAFTTLTSSGLTKIGQSVTQAAPSATDILSTAHASISGQGGNYLSFGQYDSGSGFAQWIQSSYTNPTTAAYNIVLQPVGGNVAIGSATAPTKLYVNGHMSVANGFGIYANGTLGTAGFVLTSNGTSLYWAAAGGSANNASYLLGRTWASPADIGTSVASNGIFTNVTVLNNALSVGTDSFVVSDLGVKNIGIGTALPSHALHIVKSSPVIKLQTTNNNKQLFIGVEETVAGFAANQTYIDSTGGSFPVYPLVFRSGGIENARIATDGTVNAFAFSVGSYFIANSTQLSSSANNIFTGNTFFRGGIVANGSFGANGTVLTSNGTSVFWGSITTGTVANATFATTANNALFANSASFVYGKQESQLSVANAVYAQSSNSANFANAAAWLGGFQSSYYTNATNISTGTLAEARLPFRMNQNVRTTDDVTFANGTFTGTVSIGGNLILTGNLVSQNIQSLSVIDPLIKLGVNNASDAIWGGFTFHYSGSGNTTNHAGLVRSPSTKEFILMSTFGDETAVANNNTININDSSFTYANLQVNFLRIGNNTNTSTLSVTNYTGTANNASFAYGKQESQLSVANAVFATTAGSVLGGNVSGTVANANNASFLNGRIWETAGAIGATVANTGAFTSLTASANVNIDSGTLFTDATNNRVGINNTNPTTSLHVQGNALIGGDGASNYDFKLQRLNGGIKAVQHDFAAAANSPWILHGENLSWTGERAGTVESTQAFRPYYEAFAPAVGYKEFGFANVTSGNFTGTNLIPNLVLTGTGRVGIGTTNPITPFVVSNAGAGGLEFDGSTGLIQSYNRGTSAYQTMLFDAATIVFRPSGTEAARITATGNVAIGSTDAPTKLFVNGHMSVANGFGIFANGVLGSAGFVLTSNGSSLYWANAASISGTVASANNASFLNGRIWETAGAIGSTVANTGAFTSLTASANVNIDSGTLFVDGTSNRVGVNITTPLHAHHVSGSVLAAGDASSVAYYMNDSQAIRSSGTMYIDADTSGQNGFTRAGTGDLIFRTAAAQERMRIISGGNIGIGNTTPGQRLQVDGSVGIKNGLVANGTFGISGQVLTSNGTVSYWANTSAGGFTGNTVSANATIVKNQSYYVNAAAGWVNMTMPSSIATGDIFIVHSETGNTRILNNSINIMNVGSGNDLLLESGQTVWVQAVNTSSVGIMFTYPAGGAAAVVANSSFATSANNSLYAYGKQESQLSVNNAITYLAGRTWETAGAIGSTVANTGTFTTLTASTISLNGNTTFNTSTFAINPTFKAYREAVGANTVSTASTVIDVSTFNVFNLSMTLNTTVSFTNPPASGTAYSFMLYCKQDAGGSKTITWPASVKWPNSSVPTMSTGANKIDVFNFFTLDGGTTYLGALSLANTG
jgi:hypothetical protein